MKNYEQYKQLMRTVFSIVLITVQAGLFLCVWKNKYSQLMEIPYWRKGHWLILAIYIFLIYVFPRIYGGWRVGYQRAFNIIYSQILGTFIANVIMYLLITLLTKHFENPGVLIFMMLIQMAVICLWGVCTTKLYQRAYPPRRVLLVYGDRTAFGLMEKLHTREDRFEIGESVHITQGILKIQQQTEGYNGVVICDIPSGERNLLLKYCYGKGIRTYTTPKISDVIIRSAESQHMFDTPLLMSRNNGLTIEQRIIKRTVDIVISSIVCIPAIPVMVAIAICIKLNDRGSVFYKQKRLTIGGKTFFVYKFRSMCENAEKDGVARLAEENDDRITRVGRVIRAIRLDELPQLFNILKGDMSIVGPRPERPEIAEEYGKKLPEFTYRLKAKAGLTGYAQVYGKYNTAAYDKLKLDLMYIQNYSLRLDFEIMFKTVQILFMKESTEGVEVGELIAVSKHNKK